MNRTPLPATFRGERHAGGDSLARCPAHRFNPAQRAEPAGRDPANPVHVGLPTRLELVRRVEDSGQVMPRESAFFAPKIPTGW